MLTTVKRYIHKKGGEMKEKKKKTLEIKQEPKKEDLIELLDFIYPKDLKKLYFFIVGILISLGYEFIDD